MHCITPLVGNFLYVGLFQNVPTVDWSTPGKLCVAGGVISAYWTQDREMCMRLKSYLNALMYKHTDNTHTNTAAVCVCVKLDIFI